MSRKTFSAPTSSQRAPLGAGGWGCQYSPVTRWKRSSTWQHPRPHWRACTGPTGPTPAPRLHTKKSSEQAPWVAGGEQIRKEPKGSSSEKEEGRCFPLCLPTGKVVGPIQLLLGVLPVVVVTGAKPPPLQVQESPCYWGTSTPA